MGIKFFFKWFKKTYPSHIKQVRIYQHQLPSIDHFLLDMNGIIHQCCQKVYKYGSYEEKKNNDIVDEPIDLFDDMEDDDEKSAAAASSSPPERLPSVYDVIHEIVRYVDRLVRWVNPQKSIFLAIDGVAPLSKQFQQRSRRFRSCTGGPFDSNSITPGTEFLHTISNGIHRHIVRQIERDWAHLTVLFSSEKAPGEGEHKLVKWVRDYASPLHSFMMHGMDADLVMLSLATHFPRFHILRDNPFRPEMEFFHLNMEVIRNQLVNSIMQTISDFPDQIHINDFIVMIFLTGNDFLPTIPTIELLDGGAEYMFQWYRATVEQKGPLTTETGFLRSEALTQLFGNLSQQEIQCLEHKRAKSGHFPDPLLEAHTKLDISYSSSSSTTEYDPETNFSMWRLDFPSYRRAYYREKLNINVDDDKEIRRLCMSYLEGMQWVLAYYLHGVPNWRWAYEYSYAPFLSDLVRFCPDLSRPSFTQGRDHGPFQAMLQLLCVLPRKSACLLPPSLVTVFDEMGARAYPENCDIDIDGKMHDWEGIVRLPVLPWRDIERSYRRLVKNLGENEQQRNRMGRTFQYKKGIRPAPHGLSF